MSQKKKKIVWSFGLVIGLLLQFAGICFGAEHIRMSGGICIGVGAICFSWSINGLYRLFCERKFPEMIRQEQVEMRDERNVQIRNQARSKVSSFSRWAVIGLAWVNFLVNGSLWMTFALTGVFVLIYLLEWCYTEQYQRTM